MLEFSNSGNTLTIKRNTYFLGGIFIFGIMALLGMNLLFATQPFEGLDSFLDIFGLLFLLIWESGVIYGLIYSIKESSKYIIISSEGVSSKTLFKKEFLKWEDIKDFGLSYYAQTRGEGNTYCLYFSKRVFEEKNACKKKLKGKMLKTFIFEDNYPEAVDKIIPFCKQWANVEPFIAEDKFHIM